MNVEEKERQCKRLKAALAIAIIIGHDDKEMNDMGLLPSLVVLVCYSLCAFLF